jgi:hypothetical protein
VGESALAKNNNNRPVISRNTTCRLSFNDQLKEALTSASVPQQMDPLNVVETDTSDFGLGS